MDADLAALRNVSVHPERIATLAADARTARPAPHDTDRWVRLAISLMDLTTLSATDTATDVEALCARAAAPVPGDDTVPACAAVCVYPSLVPVARAALPDDGSVKLAAVAGAFPHGQLALDLRVAEVRRAVAEGADEIDMVISRGRYLSGDLAFVLDEVAAHREACGHAKLKVILETGELPSLEHVAIASRLAIAGGAHVIKTSTGKVQPAATLEAGQVMLDVIRAHHEATGEVVGFKPAGGIRTTDDALTWLALVEATLGADWLVPERLRFGASSLLGSLLGSLGRGTP